MAFGIYVHIPYCLQRCSYCDFSTYEYKEIPPPEEYVELLKKEIRWRAPFISQKKCNTIYFGGGTPSLIEPSLIVAVLDELANQGFEILADSEVTIEINPATLTEEKLQIYREAGINRFSVGAQTFNDDLLKLAGRRHCAKDTVETLELLNQQGFNYTFDLLFALPQQTLAMLDLDLQMVKQFAPPHLSAYCLTVPESHPMQKGRAPEEEQIEMFKHIEKSLQDIHLQLYEISNFARPEKESQHNLLYWTDESYWGIGLSAHSYLPGLGEWGTRFWNLNSFQAYQKQIESLAGTFSELLSSFKETQYEVLQENQSLTDYCHTFLRLNRGLDLSLLEKKFSAERREQVLQSLSGLMKEGLVVENNSVLALTPQGRVLSNRVFAEVVF